MPLNDADRRNRLRAAKLRALVATRWELGDAAVEANFPSGATLREGGRVWVLIEDDAVHRLGAVLAIALRAGADEAHAIVADPDDAAVLARRAGPFRLDVQVWTHDGPSLAIAEPAPPAIDAAPAPGAELYRPVLADAGLTPVVEGGELIGELRGLEAARVVVDPETGDAQVQAGVGRFDREAGAMVRAGMSEADSLNLVGDLIRPVRRADAERHPMNQLVRERWLRSIVVDRPELVGARSLRPVGSAVPRRNLTEAGVATAVGEDLDGKPMVVSCSTGVYLDFVPSAADDRLTHAPDARLVLVVAAIDAAPVTRELVLQLRDPAEIVTVDDGWAAIGDDPEAVPEADAGR